jgi:hypothetical protein
MIVIRSASVWSAQSVRVVSDLDGINATLGVAQTGNQNATLSLGLPAVAINDVTINGETYKSVFLPAGDRMTVGEIAEDGKPDVPVITLLVAIPDFGGVSLEVTYSGYDDIPNINLAPIQPSTLESAQETEIPSQILPLSIAVSTGIKPRLNTPIV